MKPPGPTILLPKQLTLTLHDFVDLGEGEKCKIQAAAVVEIELIGLIDHGLIVSPSARLVAGCRCAADEPLLVGEHDIVNRILLRSQRGNAGRYPRAEITNSAAEQLETGTPRHHFARGERQCRDVRQWHLNLACISRIVRREESLSLIGIDYDQIDQHAGNLRPALPAAFRATPCA